MSAGLLTFVFEPVLLHYWGTTPGKWIFGLSVRDEDGEKLSIRTAYARLWGVFGYGNCYALPFFEWYCNYKCYRACKEEELPWDLENGCSIVVREREVRWYRVALYLLVLVLRAAAGYGIDLYAELPPNRGELTLAEYVENCNDCLKYNQGTAPYVRPDGSWNKDLDIMGRLVHRILAGRFCCIRCDGRNRCGRLCAVCDGGFGFAERLVRLSGAHDGVLRLCGRVCQMELAVCRPHEG